MTANVGRDTLHFPHVLHIIAQRSAKGIEAAVHLIHRGAVPLPLKGKDNSAVYLRLDFPYRAQHFPLAASEALPRGAALDIVSLAHFPGR